MKRAGFALLVIAVAAIAAAYAMTRDGAVPAPVIASQDAAPARPAGASLEVTYIANEGILLAAGATQVLIDGLHREYRASYPFLPEPYRDQIETAQPPFDEVDVVLVSHTHLDHFHAESVARHLQHNARARLISSEQVVAQMQTWADYAAIESRVRAVGPPVKQRVAVDGLSGDLSIDILGLGHGDRHAGIQNLGHIVRLGGKTVLHIGDASTEDASIFAAFNLPAAQIDVAFLPVWFLTSDEGEAIVRQHIKPKQIVAVHMAAGDQQSVIDRMRARFPEAAAFTVLLEKKFY
jgi:L-ascorbate metabolism protein UlaG (beta-lactamase superfamily)